MSYSYPYRDAYGAGGMSDSGSDSDDDAWPASGPASGSASRPISGPAMASGRNRGSVLGTRSRLAAAVSGRGARDRPVIPKLVIHQAGPTVFLSRQTLSPQDLADLEAAVRKVPHAIDASKMANIVRVALVTELAFALASSGPAATGSAGSAGSAATAGPSGGRAASLDAVRHTAELAPRTEAELKGALAQVLSAVDPGTELPATALLALGRVCTVDTHLKALWTARLPDSHDAWQRLRQFTGTGLPVPCLPCLDSGAQLLKELADAANIDQESDKDALVQWIMNASKCVEQLGTCGTEKKDLNATLETQKQNVADLQGQLDQCNASHTSAENNLALANSVKTSYEEQARRIKDILKMSGDDDAGAVVTTLNQRLAAAKRDVERATTHKDDCDGRLKHTQDELRAANAKCAICAQKVAEDKANEEATVLGQLRGVYAAAMAEPAKEAEAAPELAAAIKQRFADLTSKQDLALAAQNSAGTQQVNDEKTAMEQLKRLHNEVVNEASEQVVDALAMAAAIRAKCGETAAAIKTCEELQKKYEKLLQETHVFLTGTEANKGDQSASGLAHVRNKLVVLAEVRADVTMADVVQAILDKLDAVRTVQSDTAAADGSAPEERAAVAEASIAAAKARAAVAEDRAAAAEALAAAAENKAATAAIKQKAAEEATEAAQAAKETAELAQREAEGSARLADEQGQNAKQKAANAVQEETVARDKAAQANEEAVAAEARLVAARQAEADALTATPAAPKVPQDGAAADAGKAEAGAASAAPAGAKVLGDDAKYLTFTKKVLDATSDKTSSQNSPDVSDAIMDAALRRIEELATAKSSADDNDGKLDELMVAIRGVVDLDQSDGAKGGGNACTGASEFLQHVLKFFTPLSRAYSTVMTNANVVIAHWKLSLGDLQDVLAAVPTVKAQKKDTGATVASQIKVYVTASAALQKRIEETSDTVINSNKLLQADTETKLTVMLSIAKAANDHVDMAKRTEAQNTPDVGNAYSVIFQKWKLDHEELNTLDLKTFNVRTVRNGPAKTKVGERATSLFTAASQVYHTYRTMNTKGKSEVKFVEIPDLNDLVSGLDTIKTNLVQAFYSAVPKEQRATVLADLQNKLDKATVNHERALASKNAEIDSAKAAQENVCAAAQTALEKQLGVVVASASQYKDRVATLVRQQVQALSRFDAQRVNVRLIGGKTARAVALTDTLVAAHFGNNLHVTFNEKTIEPLMSDFSASNDDDVPPKSFAVHGNAVVYYAGNKVMLRIGDGDPALVSDEVSAVKGLAVGANATVLVVRGHEELTMKFTGPGRDASSDAIKVPKMPQTSSFLGLRTTSHGLLGVGFCKVSDGGYRFNDETDGLTVMLCHAQGIELGTTYEGKWKWANQRYPSNPPLLPPVLKKVVRACLMVHNSTVGFVGAVVGDLGIDIVTCSGFFEGDPQEIKIAHVFAGMKIMSADLKMCKTSGFVLAFVVERTVCTVTFNKLEDLKNATVLTGRVTKPTLKMKACSDVDGSGPFLAVEVRVGKGRCYDGVTVADGTRTCFLPWYELEPSTVFEAVRKAVKGLKDVADEPAGQRDAGIVAVGGGASAQELVAYAAAPQRGSFAQAPQSSAVLLDLLRW